MSNLNQSTMKKIVYLLVLVAGIMNAQIVTIPDANFKAKLLAANETNGYAISISTGNFMVIDANGDGEIQNAEALQVKTLAMDYFNISSLTGIESFTNLVDLSCSQNQLTTLNVTSLTNLKSLNCGQNSLSTLIVSDLSQLESLDCRLNQLTSLNLSGALNLKSLICSSNLLSNINVSQNIRLETLWCDGNNLTTLNVQGLNDLSTLFMNGNQVTTLNLSNLTAGIYFVKIADEKNQFTSRIIKQ